ncbi:MAG: hypothetical protein K2Q20_11215, partial [Phycisphaerales bacterium]|nr:hypothetical protein [Phycisphaerales bacterium]
MYLDNCGKSGTAAIAPDRQATFSEDRTMPSLMHVAKAFCPSIIAAAAMSLVGFTAPAMAQPAGARDLGVLNVPAQPASTTAYVEGLSDL